MVKPDEGQDGASILVVSGQALLREGLLALFKGQEAFRVVGSETTGLGAVGAADEFRPDVVLIDADLPPAALEHLLQVLPSASPQTRSLLLYREISQAQAVRAIQLGVRGLVRTSTPSLALLKCIRVVIGGEYWISRGLVSALAQAVAGTALSADTRRPFDLTAREIEIVQLVATGLGNKDVAAKLSLSIETVKHHLTRIFGKTGVASRVQLAILASAHGLDQRLDSTV